LSQKISEFYSAHHIEEIARASGFLKRQRKLTPACFLDSLLFNRYDNKTVSLNDYSIDIQVRHNTTLKKQSIDERFNEGSVKFIRTLLEEQIKKQVVEPLSAVCLERFSSVKIKDSTRFQLPASLKEKYPGSGGAASEAGMHIQFEFDIKSGRITTLNATDAKRQDWTDALETVSDVEENSLTIRDLGYFSPSVLLNIHKERKAFYISRIKPGIKIFTCLAGEFRELDLAKEHQALKRSNIQWKEIVVYIGEKYKAPARLLIELMPEDEIETRMRKASREAEKKGRKLSQRYRAYASLGLFITNVPKEWMEGQNIRTVYRLRWQIELRFKCWKGLCNVHNVKKMKLQRFETCLYACLLYILINWEISIWLLSGCLKRTGLMLSVYKCFKAILQCSNLLREALFNGIGKISIYLKTIEHIDYRNLVLEKRKGHLSFYEILLISPAKNNCR
jgi:Transposase DDE domain